MRKDIIVGVWGFLGFISGLWGANFGGFYIHDIDALLARDVSVVEEFDQLLNDLLLVPVQFQGLTNLEEVEVRTYFAQFRFVEDEIHSLVEAVDHVLRFEGGLANTVRIRILFECFWVADVHDDSVARVVALVNEGVDEVEASFRVIFASLGFGDRLAREHAEAMRSVLASDLGGLSMQSVFIKEVYRALGLAENELKNILVEVFGNPDLPIKDVDALWRVFACTFFRHFFFSHDQALNAAQHVRALIYQGYSLMDALLRAFLREYRSDDIIDLIEPNYRQFIDRSMEVREAMLRVMFGLYGLAGRAADKAIEFYISMFSNGRRHNNLLGVFLMSLYQGGFQIEAELTYPMVNYALTDEVRAPLHVRHWRAVFSAVDVLPRQQRRVWALFEQNLEAGHTPWYAFARAYLVLNGVSDVERVMEQLKVYENHELVAHPLEALKCALFEQIYKIKDVRQLLDFVRLYDGLRFSRM
ncbi:MAG: hypothetical protein Tsb0018_03440 [Opitutales bacterium]